MPLKGGFGCLELVLHDIRLGSEGLDFCHKEPAKGKKCPLWGHFVPKPLVGGFGCLKLVLYGIRELA